MNELTTQTTQLPETLQELARFALVGREKLAAVRAEINAIKKVGLAKEVLEQKKAEAQEIAELVTLSEVKIGKMLKEIPKVEHKGNQYTGKMESLPKGQESKTKTETIADLGFTPKQTHQFQQMADNEETVLEAIEEAKKSDDVVSRSAVLKKIDAKKKEVKKREPHGEQLMSEVIAEYGGSYSRNGDTYIHYADDGNICDVYIPDMAPFPVGPQYFGDDYKPVADRELPLEEIEAIASDLDNGQYVEENQNGTFTICDSDGSPVTTIGVTDKKKPHVVNNSTDNEWYTPAKYIESAKEVMGSIDLDPASNDFANETVKATSYFTEEDDGTQKKWYGNVWLNPPYQTSILEKFADKVAENEFEQAIVLVNNASETKWYQKLWRSASAMVGPSGRIKFEKRDGAHGTPLQGQTFFYYGKDPRKFLQVFSKYGMGTIVDASLH